MPLTAGANMRLQGSYEACKVAPSHACLTTASPAHVGTSHQGHVDIAKPDRQGSSASCLNMMKQPSIKQTSIIWRPHMDS